VRENDALLDLAPSSGNLAHGGRVRQDGHGLDQAFPLFSGHENTRRLPVARDSDGIASLGDAPQ